MGTDAWGSVRESLRKEVGSDAFKNWIEPLEFLGEKEGVARFKAPTNFLGNWVERHYGDTIRLRFRDAGLSVERLEFRTDRRPASSERPRAAAAASTTATVSRLSRARTSTGNGELPGSPLEPRYTFANFVVGKPNELAHAAARRVAEGGPVSFNPLFLHGGSGLGKTHLMHAIAWEVRRRDPEARVIYLSAEQFMYRFVQSLRFKDTISFKEMFRSVDLLMVDDVQFIAGKDNTQEEFFHTFNALVDQNRQIVLSADRAPGEIDGLEERIRSRLQWGLVADIHPTNFELRLGILQNKAELYAEHYPNVKIGDGVLEMLAHRISSNVRELEGALTKLFALGGLIGREITLEIAQDCLADQLRRSERKVTIDEILRKVADHYAVRMSDMLGPRRVRSITRPRQMAMYLAKTLTSKSLPEIGRRIGNRDHTTVLHAVRKIEELMRSDAQIAEDAELLRRMLES